MNIKLKLLADFSASDMRPYDYTFLNFASIGQVFSRVYSSDGFSYMVDGFATSLIFSALCMRTIKRKSFDFTSIADQVFKYASENSRSVVVVGGSAQAAVIFEEKIGGEYKNMKSLVCMDGYFNDESACVAKVLSLKPDIAIIGLGAGKQESFMSALRKAGYTGVSFSCGGFISQTAMSSGLEYYPKIFDRLNIRFIYRMYKEPHTIRRYLVDYPRNLAALVVRVIKRDVILEVVK